MEVAETEIVLEGERIKGIRKALKLSQSAFGKRVKIDQGAISDYENGRNKPSERTVEAILKEYSINRHWWETGNGDVFIGGQIAQKSGLPKVTLNRNSNGDVQPRFDGSLIDPDKTKLYLSQLPEKEAELYIPYYDVEITAGILELFFDDIDEQPEGFIYAPQYRGCVACMVKGDSMYEMIYPGARLYVEFLRNKKYIDFGQTYLVVLDGYRLLKYVRAHPTDDSKVILSSHNKKYDDWAIEKADILHLFIVKGYENQNAN